MPGSKQSNQFRQLRQVQLDSTLVRSEVLQNEEYLVIPVVMLVGDIVVEPLGSTGREFIPAENIAANVDAWNGKPVILDHPQTLESANKANNLEKCLGFLLNTEFKNNKLISEVWLSKSKCEYVGEEGLLVLENAQNSKVNEVSIGADVVVLEQSGVTDSGDEYDFIWLGAIPDHLAILSEGKIGACACADGCGTLRAAQATQAAQRKGGGMFNGLGSMFRTLINKYKNLQDTTDRDLYRALDKALKEEVTGYYWVEAIYVDETDFVYCKETYSEAYTLQYYRRGYTLNDDGTVTLDSNITEVYPKTIYENEPQQIQQLEKKVDTKHNCSCEDPNNCQCEENPMTDKKKESTATQSVDDAVDITPEVTPTVTTSEPTTQLQQVTTTNPDPNMVMISLEEKRKLEAAYEDLESRKLAEKTALITEILHNPQMAETFTKEQLESKSDISELKQLRALANKLSGGSDYSVTLPADDLAQGNTSIPDAWGLNKLTEKTKSTN